MASGGSELSTSITRGTRNVFADLGFPNAAGRQARLRLEIALNQLLDERRPSPAETAKALGVSQAELPALQSYELSDFSSERLMLLLTALHRDVECARHGIVITRSTPS